MRARLNDLLLELTSSDPQVQDTWRVLFDLEIQADAAGPDEETPHIRLAAAVSSSLQTPPQIRPSYQGSANKVRYYASNDGGFLDLARPAQILFDFPTATAQITLNRDLLDGGNLEDLTLIALAPFLRRRGLFITHAFSSAQESAVLLCGPPGSGKTTTGLALLNQGWEYLANDAALLQDMEGQVMVLPSPGAINLHPDAFSLLPGYSFTACSPTLPAGRGKIIYPRGTLLPGKKIAGRTAVSTVFFLTFTNQSQPALHEVPRAIGLARLIEENVDQWDQDTYLNHIDLLTTLSRQAAFYDLHLIRGQPLPADILLDF